jgi:hypothetical protein
VTPNDGRRRTLAVLAVAAVVALPAVVLRVLCVGRACAQPAEVRATVPFCSLPEDTRRRIADGFRDGRSPDVLAATAATPVRGSRALGALGAAWPSARGPAPTVPIVLSGTGVRAGAPVPTGTGLRDVAPTVAEIIGLRRAHPEVRSGEAVPGVATGRRPRLVVTVVWKGVGGDELAASRRAWPTLRGLLRDGAGTLRGQPGSQPLDPAALLATLGTGGLPREHGITGTLVRNDRGAVVRAWGPGAPFSVIAALGDDLDRRLRQEPRIGLVGTDVADRGVIGGNWYLQNDRDDVDIGSGSAAGQAARAERLLATGYGADDVPDLLVVVMEGPVRAMDRALARVVAAARRASGGSVALVVISTGPAGDDGVGHDRVARQVERAVGGRIVEATAVGGLFLDQRVLAGGTVTQDDVLTALRRLRAPGGGPLLADAFTGVAVSLARYC